MYHPLVYVEDAAPTAPPTLRRACLVEGCPCKDARMVSRRRAAFFAAVALGRGQTAHRVVDTDPTWRLPTVDA